MLNKKKEDCYKINLEINKEEILKDIRDIKKEVENTVKNCEYEISKLNLKRKDILVIKVHAFYKANDMEKIKKKIEKQLHRRVLLINDHIDIDHVISYRKNSPPYIPRKSESGRTVSGASKNMQAILRKGCS